MTAPAPYPPPPSKNRVVPVAVGVGACLALGIIALVVAVVIGLATTSSSSDRAVSAADTADTIATDTGDTAPSDESEPSTTTTTTKPSTTTRPSTTLAPVTTVAPLPSPTTAAPPPAPPAPSRSGPYPVLEVVDGDTVKVSIDGSSTTLRLIGLDTPETKDPRKPVQCFGREASAHGHELLDGQAVELEYDDSQGRLDKYDRTLAYVWLPDGRLYNQVMIEEGYAHEYTYDLPYRYQADFRAAERQARSNDRGLWSPSTCSGDTEQAAGGEPPAPAPGPAPAPPPRAEPAPSGGCDPNYTPCVPVYPPDVDCGDLSGSVTVTGEDVHGLDRDGDGAGCE